MNYLTIGVENKTDIILITKLLKQIKGIKEVISHDFDVEWTINKEDINKEDVFMMEQAMSDEWLQPEEDEIWNEYLKKKINE